MLCTIHFFLIIANSEMLSESFMLYMGLHNVGYCEMSKCSIKMWQAIHEKVADL